MRLLDVQFDGTFAGPVYRPGPGETVGGTLRRSGTVDPWRNGLWLRDDAATLVFESSRTTGDDLLIEVVIRRDLAVDPCDMAVLSFGDLRYLCAGGQWALSLGGKSVPAPAPTSAFPQHLAILVHRGEGSTSVSCWLNGWQVGTALETSADLDGSSSLVLGGAGDERAAMRGFVTALAVSTQPIGLEQPEFVVASIPANVVPVNADDPEELLVRKAARVRPSDLQYQWQQLELTAFVHFGMATFADVEGGDGREDPALFDPAELDCRQWARALKRAGFTMAILTTKHADGFLLWPTRYAQHSVAAAPWKDGNGDVVDEFVSAMRAEGLRVGLYFSPLSRHEMRVVPSDVDPRHHRFGGSEDKPECLELIPGPGRDVPSDQQFEYRVDEYNAVYLRQLHELLTEYGEIDEVWLDGNADWFPDGEVRQRFSGRLWYDLARKLQPQVKFFNGWELRWVGNEDGLARDAEWSVLPITGDLGENQPAWTTPEPEAPLLGDRSQWPGATHFVWHPAEVDVSIRDGWFHHPSEQPKTVTELMEIYVRSVGRNTNLLLNVPADTRGLLPEVDLEVLNAFAAERARAFGDDLVCELPRPWWAETNRLEVSLREMAPIRYVEIAEELLIGQRVERFKVYVRADGSWMLFGEGATIGHKRIVDAGEPRVVDAVALEIVSARDVPCIAGLKAYRYQDQT